MVVGEILSRREGDLRYDLRRQAFPGLGWCPGCRLFLRLPYSFEVREGTIGHTALLKVRYLCVNCGKRALRYVQGAA